MPERLYNGRMIQSMAEYIDRGELKHALEVIRDECKSHPENCRDCPLCRIGRVGMYCEMSDIDKAPADWILEEMIHKKG